MTTYGDVHRRFLQSFVYHPINTEAEALEAYRLTCEEQGQEMGSLNQIVDTINATIRKYTTLEIKTIFCELTGQKYYIATNTADLKWTKNTSRYSKNEQLIFRKVLDDIVRSETGNISSITCLNVYSNVNMSKSEMSATIAKFVRDGWFAEKKGRLYMGVRAAAELEPFITQVYQDMTSSCPLCKKLIFWARTSLWELPRSEPPALSEKVLCFYQWRCSVPSLQSEVAQLG
ncbi:Non-structural maintenance of chromosomes element 1 homolog [Gryllus bimaculatus]|nr:Non-structural maintenance of chromosomes element 1 homolog [Gryllus bimaculatus]